MKFAVRNVKYLLKYSCEEAVEKNDVTLYFVYIALSRRFHPGTRISMDMLQGWRLKLQSANHSALAD